jgi:hypothetical protein
MEIELRDPKNPSKTITFTYNPAIPDVLYFKTNSSLVGHISMADELDSDIHFYIHDHATVSCRGTHKANPIVTIRRDEFPTRFIDRTKEPY